MKQQTLAMAADPERTVRTVPQADPPRHVLATMERIVPWDALLDTALRRFVGIDLGRERVPDATTLLNFRRLLDKHDARPASAPVSAA